MDYDVVITPQAQHRLDMYVGYTMNSLKNPQAAKSILLDAKTTKQRFIMLYRIVQKTIVVEGMYHELQDYESIFVNEMRIE